MKEDSFNFSLRDFLAYLFPGTMMLLAVAAFLKLSPFEYVLRDIPQTIVTGLLLIGCAYFVGIAVASLTVSLEKPLAKLFKTGDPVGGFTFEGFEGDVKKAFGELFGAHSEWSAYHFYIARAFVLENMPNCAQTVDRQNSLRQMRRNCILPVSFLGIAGVTAGAEIYGQHALWGVGFIVASLLGSIAVIRNLVKVGMHKNREREVREVLAGLLAYYYTNVNKRVSGGKAHAKDERIPGGEPVIEGTRTPVRAVAELWRMGVAPEEITTHLSHLTQAQVFNALSYYSDHTEEINRHIERNRVGGDIINTRIRDL